MLVEGLDCRLRLIDMIVELTVSIILTQVCLFDDELALITASRLDTSEPNKSGDTDVSATAAFNDFVVGAVVKIVRTIRPEGS